MTAPRSTPTQRTALPVWAVVFMTAAGAFNALIGTWAGVHEEYAKGSFFLVFALFITVPVWLDGRNR